MYLCEAGSPTLSDRNFRYVILVRLSMFRCLYFTLPAEPFFCLLDFGVLSKEKRQKEALLSSEIQGKTFVIHLSFGDRNPFLNKLISD